MEKVKLGLFDLFSFVLPGFIILISSYVILNPITDVVVKIMEFAKDLSAAQIFLVLVTSYFIGIFMQYASFEVFEFTATRIWRKRLNATNLALNQFESQMSRIRHESPLNYELLEKWMALRGMCYNSFFAFFILLIALLLRILINKCIVCDNIWFLLLFIMILCVLSLRRAITFHEWSLRTINSTISYLDTKK